MPAPTFVGAGGTASGLTASISPPWPAHQAGDLGILVVETTGGSTANHVPTGWTAVPMTGGNPRSDLTTTAGARLLVAYRFATSSAEATPALGAATDHSLARIYVFRGVDPTTPFSPASGVSSVKTTASTTQTTPAITTTVAETLLVSVASRPDDSSSTTHFGTITGGTGLSAQATGGEAGTTNGNGGGFVLGYATKLVAGSTGTPTRTKAVSTTDVSMAFGLRPAPAAPATTPVVMEASFQWSVSRPKLDTLVDPLTSYATSGWVTTGTAANVAQEADAVRVGLSTTYTGLRRTPLSESWDFTESSVAIRVTRDWAVPSGEVFLQLISSTADTDRVQLGFGKSAIAAQVYTTAGGLTFGTYPGVPPDHNAIRVRHVAGTLYWDTSADGVTWVQRATTAAPAWDLRSVRLAIIGGRWNSADAVDPATDLYRVHGINTDLATPVALTPVTAAWDARWAVASPTVVSLGPVRWAVATAVERTGQARWSVRTPLQRTADARWSVRTPLTRTADARWGVRTRLERTGAAQWGVRARLEVSRASEWGVATRVERLAVLQWTQDAPVVLVLGPVRWSVASRVERTADARWSVRARLERLASSRWGVSTALQRTADARWSVRSRLERTASTRWTVASRVERTADARWSALARVERAAQALWQIAGAPGQVAIEATSRWRVQARLERTASARWTVRQALERTASARWSVRSVAARVADARWIVRSRLERTASARWVTSARLERATSTRWAVAESVAVERDAWWDVLQAVEVEGQSAWDVLEAVELDLAATWEVLQAVEALAAFTWDVAQSSKPRDLGELGVLGPYVRQLVVLGPYLDVAGVTGPTVRVLVVLGPAARTLGTVGPSARTLAVTGPHD